MVKVSLSFPDVSTMVYFIIAFKLSDYIADWPNASLTVLIEKDAIDAACFYYEAVADKL